MSKQKASILDSSLNGERFPHFLRAYKLCSVQFQSVRLGHTRSEKCPWENLKQQGK